MDRATISNHYSRIPLQLMARAARDNGIVFKDIFDKREEVPPALNAVQLKIDAYVASTTLSKAEDWTHAEPWLRDLRHGHLHFSAKFEFGLKPRYIKGKRRRMVYSG